MQSRGGIAYIKTMEANQSFETKQPTHTELVTLWMATFHRGEQAVVFFNPVGDGGRVPVIEKRLGLNVNQITKLICCDVYIHPVPETVEGLCTFVNYMDQEVYGFVMAWDGTTFVSHN